MTPRDQQLIKGILHTLTELTYLNLKRDENQNIELLEANQQALLKLIHEKLFSEDNISDDMSLN